MEITYLGSAAAEGIPALFCRCSICEEARRLGGKNIRTRLQALIDRSILIDYSADTMMHCQAQRFNLIDLDALVITHSHQDHWYPEDLLLRKPPYGWGIEAPLPVYGNTAVARKLAALEQVGEQSSVQPVTMIEVRAFEPFKVGCYTITALPATHDRREECFVYLVETDRARLLYAHDTGLLPQKSEEYLKGIYLNVVSMDCTMGSLKDGKNHMGLQDTQQFIQRLQAIGCIDENTQCVIAHFSHNGGLLHHELEERTKSWNYIVAFDGMSISC
jgi:phosphoribosyl 1,2-cyclic phosphate phosphodiesterase